MTTEHEPINAVHEAHELTTAAPPVTAPRAPNTQFMARIMAYVGDMAARACVPMDPIMWKRQGISTKDAADRPPAAAFLYAGSTATRAVFDRTVRVTDGKKLKEYDGVWLRVGIADVDLGGGKKGPLTLDPPQPLLPRLAMRANANTALPLHITDREDAAIAIAASGGAVLGIATGATLFANPEKVDAHTPDLPRPLHPACDKLTFGGRDIVFIFEDRTAAVNIARGLRQGDGHTGKVDYVSTSNFLSQVDSAISQGFDIETLHTHTMQAAATFEEDLLPSVTSGNPGSVGSRVPLHMLQCLPADVRDLSWPMPEGGGTSWDNLDWGLTRNGTVNGLFRDQKGEEFALNKPALTLHTPIYITRRATMEEGTGEDYVELMWAEPGPKGYSRKSLMMPSQHVFGGSGRELLKAGVPIADARRAAQWFNAFRAANPQIPVTQMHDQAGWVFTDQGMHFLMPDSPAQGHEIQRGVLPGVVRTGPEKKHWEYTRDFYNACDPLNQILMVAPHASLLLAALRMPGCVFGLVDESSSGKSVFLQTAARQYGWEGGDYAFDASNPPTAAFLERVVYRSNGLCILIDEFHKFPNTHREARGNSYTRQEAAYFLSNGQRRGRSNVAGGVDASPARVYCYSIVAGERKYITALDRASQMDGARVRMITLPLLGYAKPFLEKYDGLPGFMDGMKTVKGHVGIVAANTIAAELNRSSANDMRTAVGALTTRLKRVFAKYGADTNVSQRRATFLAPIIYTELLLGRAHPASGMWATKFDETCVVRAIAGAHRDRLMCLEEGDATEADEVSVANTILEALRRDPTLIQGLKEDQEKPNPHPLARIPQKRKGTHYSGLQLYPKAVFQMLRRHGIQDAAARDLLRDSGDFVLQKSATEPPRLLHRSNGAQWLVPVAGWGWDLLLAAPGDVEARAKDPYYDAREAFTETYEEEASKAPNTRAALLSAVDRQMAHLKSITTPQEGTLEAQLLLLYEPAWRALFEPLADRLSDKDDNTYLGDIVWEHLRCNHR